MKQDRRAFLKAAGLGGAALTLHGCTSAGGRTARRPAHRNGDDEAGAGDRPPNIVFILVDDLGYGDLGCYGSKDIKTPNIDAMATGGMKFTDFYVNAPVCSPTRAGFMTGRSQQRCGAETVFTPGNLKKGLPINETTLAEELKRGGYTTGIFGKWHLGYIEKYSPVNRGFDEFVGHLSGFLDYHTHVNPRFGYDWWDGLKKTEGQGYSTDLISKHSMNFVRAHKDEPFFLFVSYQAPHSPYQGPDDEPLIELKGDEVVKKKKKFTAEQRYAIYVKMVEYMDKTIGDLLQVLREEGLAENTLVMFVSDNGPSYLAGTTGGLKGGKHFLWEGGIRVPAVAYWPGKIEPGAVTGQPATILDTFPTFLALAGMKPRDNLELDGMDLRKLLLKQESLPQRALCWRYAPQGQVAVRQGKWKLIGRWNSKAKKPDFEKVKKLFDLEEDPGEKNDLAEQKPETVTKLIAAYEKWEEGIRLDHKRLERT